MIKKILINNLLNKEINKKNNKNNYYYKLKVWKKKTLNLMKN